MADKKKVLVLGAGLVAGPLVRYLAGQGHQVTTACRTLSRAQALIEGVENTDCMSVDVTDPKVLNELVPQYDLIMSFVPHIYHMLVARACLDHGKNLVTSSYIKPEMKAMDKQVKQAGLTFLNELGLDPGIDHMSAMEIIDRVKHNGGQVTEFQSNCGGLPAPEANDNPWGYKFSWSPRGVLLAGTNTARYFKDGQFVNVESKDLFAHHWPMTVDELGDFEFYPNRDCIGYIEMYGLEGIRSMFRGTIRNVGWCRLWKKMVDVGYLSLEERDDLEGKTYGDLTAMLVGGFGEGLKEMVASFMRIDADDEIIQKMEWLGLFGDTPIPAGTKTVLDALSERMQQTLTYAQGERDMIILQHRFEVKYQDREETIISTLVDYGIPNGESSMSRTVGLPSAIGADLILKGVITRKGVLAPTTSDIYEPVLAKLNEIGIRFEEKILSH